MESVSKFGCGIAACHHRLPLDACSRGGRILQSIHITRIAEQPEEQVLPSVLDHGPSFPVVHSTLEASSLLRLGRRRRLGRKRLASFRFVSKWPAPQSAVTPTEACIQLHDVGAIS